MWHWFFWRYCDIICWYWLKSKSCDIVTNITSNTIVLPILYTSAYPVGKQASCYVMFRTIIVMIDHASTTRLRSLWESSNVSVNYNLKTTKYGTKYHEAKVKDFIAIFYKLYRMKRAVFSIENFLQNYSLHSCLFY